MDVQNFELQQLRMFWLLVKNGSFTETARVMHLTQSAISHGIQKLRRTVESDLFTRSGRGFRLTESGRVLYDACEIVFQTLEDSSERIALQKGQSIGTINFGATVEFGCTILMRHISGFMEAHPEITMNFYMSHELLVPLIHDDLDIIIDCKVHKRRDLACTTLFREKYVVVCAPAYRDLNRIESVSDLSNCTILSVDADLVWWRKFFLAVPEFQRPEIPNVICINHIRGIITAARTGLGVAFVPRYCILNDLRQGELVALYPQMELLEDRFAIYQKKTRSGLIRHRLLTEYLTRISPDEFGV